MTDNVEILTKVYGYVNQIKVCLALNDIAGIWKVVNELSDYLVSVDCAPNTACPRGESSPLAHHLAQGVIMDLSSAHTLYEYFLKLLAPVSQRVEVVGSVKRADLKAYIDGVHDLEFLIIPDPSPVETVLLGEQPKNKLEQLIQELIANGILRPATRKADGDKFKKFAIVGASASPEECTKDHEKEFCLELYLVTERTWAVQNVIRTGPSAFSHRFVTPDNQQAFHKPTGKLYKGLLPVYYEYMTGETVIRVRSSGRVLDLKEEADAIRLLGLRPESNYWIPPEERYMYT